MYKSGEIVTMELRTKGSNTFIYVGKLNSEQNILTHPLANGMAVIVPDGSINVMSAGIKDSVERCLDYANKRKTVLQPNTKVDLECLSVYYGLKRTMSPNLKKILANISGTIAAIEFGNDINATMKFISNHRDHLDDFNLMWFNNFKGLFNGSQPITSEKQSNAIYNMAGFVLAELATPTILQK